MATEKKRKSNAELFQEYQDSLNKNDNTDENTSKRLSNQEIYKLNQATTLLGNPATDEEFEKAYNNMTYVISSSVQDYLNQYNSFFSEYKTEDEAKDYANQLKIKNAGLKNLLSEYGVLFNSDYVSEVSNFLDSAYGDSTEGGIDKGVEFWSQFKTKDDYDLAYGSKETQIAIRNKNYDYNTSEIAKFNAEIATLESQIGGSIKDISNQITNLESAISNRENAYVRAGYSREDAKKMAKEQNANDSAKLTQLYEWRDTYNGLAAQRDALVAENTRYERGEGVTDSVYTEYKYVMEKPDFAELSKAGESKITNHGFSGDDKYDYINNIKGLRNTYSAQALRSGSGNSYKKYDTMTEDEIGVYNYLYATEGADSANAYLEKLDSALDVRNTDANAALHQKLVEENPFYAAMANISTVITKPYVEVMAFADSVVSGKDYNPYSKWQSGRNAVNAIREATTKVIEENTDWKFLGQNVWGQIYNAGMSTADSIYGVGTFGKWYTLVAASGASTNKAAELYEKGASGDQIFLGATAAGLAEAAFEKISIDRLIKIKNPDSFLKILKEGFKQAGIEGTEEIFTEIANIISDEAIMGSQSDFNLAIKKYQEEDSLSYEEAYKKALQDKASDVIWAGISGMLSGGASGGVTTTIQGISNYSAGKNIQKQGDTETMILAGIDASQDSQAFKLAEKTFNDYTSKGKVSNMRLGALKQTTMEDVVDQYRNRENLSESEIQEKLESKGIDSKEAAKFASIVAKLSRREKLSEREKNALKENDIAQEMADEISTAETVNSLVANIQLAKIDSLGKEKNADTPDTYEVSKTEGKTLMKDSKAEVEIVDVASIDNGTLMLKVNDGTEVKEVNAENISFANNKEAVLYEAIAQTDIDATLAKTIIGNFDANGKLSARNYIYGAYEAYTYGKYNFPTEEMSNDGFSADLTQKQREDAYRLGQIAQKKSVDTQENAVNKAIEGAKKNRSTKNGKKGNVHYEGVKTDSKAFTERQNASIKALEVVAKALGVDIYLYESELDGKGSRAYTDKDGKRITANGFYDPKTGDIHIDIHAGLQGEQVMLLTAAHELTHFVRQWSPAKFKVLADFLMAEYGKEGISVTELIRKKQYELNVSYDTAYEEVIADSMQTMLTDGAVVEKLAKLAKQDKTLVEKMVDCINDLVNRIKNAYADTTAYTDEGQYAAMLKEGERLQELFYDALVSAGENYKGAGGKMNNANAEVKLSARDSEGTPLTEAQQKYFKDSVVRDADGNLIVVYHGTETGGFTVFDPLKSKDHISLFFTDDMDLAYSYSGDMKRMKLPKARKEGFFRDIEPQHKGKENNTGIYKAYLNLTNPYVIDGKGKRWDQIHEFYKEFNTQTNNLKFAYDKDTFTLTVDAVINGETVSKTFDLSKAQKSDRYNTSVADGSAKEAITRSNQAHAIMDYAKPMVEEFYKELGIQKAFKDGRTSVEQLIFDTVAYPENFAENEAEGAYNQDVVINADTGEVMNRVTTRMVAEWALEQGYDGVIFKDIIDVGGQGAVNADKPRNVYVAFNSEQVKDVDNKNPTENKDIRYSERTPNSVSNRSLLANALEDTVQNDIEKNKLKQYKEKIDFINAEERKLADLNRQLKELRFSKGKRDAAKTKQINDLQAEATKTANRITIYDRQLLNLETTAALKNVLEREKAKVRKKQKQRDAEILKEMREEANATIINIMNRNTESRKRAVEGRHKTIVRNKIKRAIKDLNSVFNRGTKERNVKIGLRETVRKALEASEVLFSDEITNEDIVRLGVDSVSEQDKEKLDRYATLLALREAKEDAVEISRINSQISKLNRDLKDVFIRERARLNKENVSSALDALAEAYASLQNSDDDYIKNNAFVQGMHDRITKLSKDLDGVIIKDMSLEQLEEVYKMYSSIKHMITSANSIFRDGLREDLSKKIMTVQGEILALQKDNRKDPRVIVDTISNAIKSFDWNNQKPVYAFEKLGSKAFQELFWDAVKAEGVYAQDIVEAGDFLDSQKDKFKYADWDFKKAKTFKSANGLDFKLTLADMMSIYAYSKRPQAFDHMTQGGFTFDRGSTYVDEKGRKRKHVRLSETYTVSIELINEIVKTLSEEQIGYVDAVQAYLTSLGEKGNEISRTLYGIDLFTEKVYFPLKSDADYRSSVEQALNETQTQVSLKNTGMTKQTVPHANNPIVLQGFDDVVLGHIDNMSKYHSFVLPIENLRRVFDNVSRDENASYDATKVIIESVFGQSAKQYFDQYITDLNGGVHIGGYQNIFMDMFSKMKKTAVSASLSVVVQQPFAVVRAMNNINPVYFAPANFEAAKKGTDVKSQWEELKRYAPIAIIKEMGGFDVGSSRTTRDYIGGTNYKGFGGRIKGFFKDSDYRSKSLDNAFMWGAAKADEIGWSTIWKAVKREVASQHKELAVGSEEFLQKCGERFTEVVVYTQVYDSVNSRSGMMRSKRDLDKFATSFMGEPTTTINMIENSMLKLARAVKSKEGVAKASAAMGRTVGVTLGSILLTSLAKSLIYAGRDDDDEDKALLERWAKHFGDSLTNDLNPLTMIPYLRDFVSIWEGWDVERPDMTVVADIVTSIKKAIEEGCDLEEALALIGNAGNAFGLPAKNIIREVQGFINVFNDVSDYITDDFKSTDIKGAFVEGWTGEEQSNKKALYNAIANGNKAKIEVIRAEYKTEEAYESALKSAIRESHAPLKQTVIDMLNGKFTNKESAVNNIASELNLDTKLVDEAINAEYSYFTNKLKKAAEALAAGEKKDHDDIVKELRERYRGIFSQDEIVKAIKEVDLEEDKDADDEEKTSSVYKTWMIEEAFDNGDNDTAFEMINDIVEAKTENYIKDGYKQKEAESKAKSSVKSSLTSYWKPIFLEAYADKDTAEQKRIRQILIKSGLYGRTSEVIDTTQQWIKDSKKKK